MRKLTGSTDNDRFKWLFFFSTQRFSCMHARTGARSRSCDKRRLECEKDRSRCFYYVFWNAERQIVVASGAIETTLTLSTVFTTFFRASEKRTSRWYGNSNPLKFTLTLQNARLLIFFSINVFYMTSTTTATHERRHQFIRSENTF